MAQLTVARYKRAVIAAKIEATYDTDPTLAGADVLALRDVAVATPREMFADERQSGLIWPLPGIPGIGETIVSGQALLAGAGAAYSASVKPSVDAVLRAMGFAAAGSFVASSEKWTYTPLNAATMGESVTAALYAENAPQAKLTGGMATGRISGRTGNPDALALSLRGRYVTRADVTAVTANPSTVQPPVSKAAVFTWAGITTLRLWEFTVDFGTTIGRALSASGADGVAGFFLSPGGMTATFVIEQVPVATYDLPARLADAALVAASWQTGTAQYNRIKYTAPKVQVTGLEQTIREGLLCWQVTARLTPSVGADELTILFD